MSDYFSRTQLLLGEQTFCRLQQAHIVIAGLGAVGSFAAEALVRSGVRYLRLVDADIYAPSDLNRQLGAERATLGRCKVDAFQAHLKRIHPDITIETLPIFIDDQTASSLCQPFQVDGVFPDIVIDAIDTLDAKVALIETAVRAHIDVLSCMGAARKRLPQCIRVADISQTEVCPLAREVRKKLRHKGIETGVRCVFSIEKPTEFTHLSHAANAHSCLRRPSLGSIISVTGTFGLRLAAECLDIIAQTTNNDAKM